MNLSKRKSLTAIFAIAFISFLISTIMYLFDFFKTFEYSIYDLLSRNINPAKKSESIYIIYIDQTSLEELSKQGITWPWPRQIYAPLIDFLSEADAVFIDILFTESSSYGVEDDIILAESVKKAGNVYLPVALSKAKRDFDEKYLDKISTPTYVAKDYGFQSAIFPIEPLKENAKGLGNVSIWPDEDGVYRRVPLFFRIKEHVIPNFVMTYMIQGKQIQVRENSVLLGDVVIPLYHNSLLLKYSSDKQPFRVYSFVEVLFSATSQVNNSNIKKETFSGKKVFIGLSAAGLFDLKPTPVSNKTPGVFVHATTLTNLIERDFIRIFPKAVVLTIVFIVSLIVSFIFIRQHSMKINLLSFLGILMLLSFFEIIFFRFSMYMDFLPSFMALMSSSVLSLIYSYATEGREKSFIKKTFLQYMDKRIVEHLLANPELISAGGQKKTVTVFFADIAGFTTISEKLSAEETAMMLHRVLNKLTEVVIKNYGVVDKYIGDCIMAFWGAPLKTEEDEVNACRTALECMDALSEINKEFEREGLPQINIRIGIHTGDAVVGNIGSDRLFNYTVIGDTVNIASRLESANKFFKTKIIISEDTFYRISDRFIVRQLGIITVKGKTRPIGIYELLSDTEKADQKVIDFAEKFNRAFALFKEKKWGESMEIFNILIGDFSNDFPTQFYLKKIEELSEARELTENWFVVKIEEK